MVGLGIGLPFSFSFTICNRGGAAAAESAGALESIRCPGHQQQGRLGDRGTGEELASLERDAGVLQRRSAGSPSPKWGELSPSFGFGGAHTWQPQAVRSETRDFLGSGATLPGTGFGGETGTDVEAGGAGQARGPSRSPHPAPRAGTGSRCSILEFQSF